ncbi:hypothetical protein Btru_028847 [Bulinus truncatus]|nr:hypothetical protein Btru_028847 [Bulinus truncatus]
MFKIVTGLKNFLFLATLFSVMPHLHASSFDKEKYCAQRCLLGQGGILCGCNAVHFNGKRSESVLSIFSSGKNQKTMLKSHNKINNNGEDDVISSHGQLDQSYSTLPETLLETKPWNYQTLFRDRQSLSDALQKSQLLPLVLLDQPESSISKEESEKIVWPSSRDEGDPELVDDTQGASNDVVRLRQVLLQAIQGSVQFPLTSVQFPLTSVQFPLTSVQFPTTSVQFPLTSVQFPLTSVQFPLTSVQFPMTSVQFPMTSVQFPVTSVQVPLTSVHFPLTSVHYLKPLPSSFLGCTKFCLASLPLSTAQVGFYLAALQLSAAQVGFCLAGLQLSTAQVGFCLAALQLSTAQVGFCLAALQLSTAQVGFCLAALQLSTAQVGFCLTGLQLFTAQVGFCLAGLQLSAAQVGFCLAGLQLSTARVGFCLAGLQLSSAQVGFCLAQSGAYAQQRRGGDLFIHIYWTCCTNFSYPLLDLLYKLQLSVTGPAVQTSVIRYWTCCTNFSYPLLDLL